MVRLHHYSDEGDRDPQPDASCSLIVDQSPIAGTALGILLTFGRIIKGKLDIVKGPKLVVCENGRAMPVRCNGELQRQRAEVGQNLSELRMHSVLAGAQIDGADRQAFHHSSHLLEVKPVSPPRIPAAKGTTQTALVGQPAPDPNPTHPTK